MATSPDLTDMWMTPAPISHDIAEDIWRKFDVEDNKAVVCTIPEANITDISMTITSEMPPPVARHSSSPSSVLVTPPTPPHSPPSEPELDDLVASIPEILESPTATAPADISDILNDLEATPLGEMLDGGWGANASSLSWWNPLPNTSPEDSLKRDIMWGGGNCCSSAMLDVPIKKERQLSECSADISLRETMCQELSDDDSDENMPDTPSGTDDDDEMEEANEPVANNAVIAMKNTNSAARYVNNNTNNNKMIFVKPSKIAILRNNNNIIINNNNNNYLPVVNKEHNYCGKVPTVKVEKEALFVSPGIVTPPTDSEFEEVDIESCNDQPEPIVPNIFSVLNTAKPTIPTIPQNDSSNLSSGHISLSGKHTKLTSIEVKRQLQLRIQSMRNYKKQSCGVPIDPTKAPPMSNRLLGAKIKTQGKPAAYTKRMRDYHSEVMKTTRHRRRPRGETDEGRRSVHNSLERQRRVDLRNAFEYLRMLVPETQVLDKAPKVQILKKASLHCKHLQITEQRLIREKEKLRKQVEYLEQRLRVQS